MQKVYYFTDLYVSKEYQVFTQVIFPIYIQCPHYIIFLNTYESLHDSFLISIFNYYYFSYIFVSKGILLLYLRQVILFKLYIFSILYDLLNTCESLHDSFISISKNQFFLLWKNISFFTLIFQDSFHTFILMFKNLYMIIL